jgi:hypothetical protein
MDARFATIDHAISSYRELIDDHVAAMMHYQQSLSVTIQENISEVQQEVQQMKTSPVLSAVGEALVLLGNELAKNPSSR